MAKLSYLSFFLALLASVSSCHAEEVSLTIDNLRLEKDNLQFDFVLRNNTDTPIWFCKDIDDKSSIDYEIKIDKKEISFKFISVTVPPNIFLEEPIWARYSKLESRSKFKGSIKVKVPISELTYFKKKTSESLQSLSYADTLNLEVGVYRVNLGEQKKVCCRDDSNSEDAFVNCFWAERNKEQIIKTQLKHQKLPIIIQ